MEGEFLLPCYAILSWIALGVHKGTTSWARPPDEMEAPLVFHLVRGLLLLWRAVRLRLLDEGQLEPARRRCSDGPICRGQIEAISLSQSVHNLQHLLRVPVRLIHPLVGPCL